VLRTILSRLLHTAPVLWAAATLVWIFMFIIPGDPGRNICGRTADPRVLAQVRSDLELDRPPLERYLKYLGRLSTGDLGVSYIRHERVIEILGRAFQKTIFLAGAGALIAAIAGLGLGAAAARKRGSMDTFIAVGTLAGISIPTFWLGLLLILLFASGLRWLPVSGYGEGIEIVGLHAPQAAYLVLPAITLAVFPASLIARVTRATLREELCSGHVRAARARGIGASSLLWRHAFRNVLGPIVTLVGLLVAGLLGGAVATEIVFSWPGIGREIFEALQERDLPVVEGGVLLLTAIFLAANLVVDLAYAWIDPRVRLGRS
jgi:ABC-type dipeptide/oligopeptide/nickel transport system permease component